MAYNKDESSYTDATSSTKNSEKRVECDTVNGLDNLRIWLNDLAEQLKNNPAFLKQPHRIMYELGKKRALIQVQTNQTPYEIWYCDLQGRAPMPNEQEAFRQFLSEKCGQTDLSHFHNVNSIADKVDASVRRLTITTPVLETAEDAMRQIEIAMKHQDKLSAPGQFGMFGNSSPSGSTPRKVNKLGS